MLNDDKEISNVEQFDVSYDEVILFYYFFSMLGTYKW